MSNFETLKSEGLTEKQLNDNNFTDELKAALSDGKISKAEARELWLLFTEKRNEIYHVSKKELNKLRQEIESSSKIGIITDKDLKGLERKFKKDTITLIQEQKENNEVLGVNFQDLLDFIAKGEGTNDSYNMKFGGKEVPNLTNMTIKEAINYQSKLSGHTALGRYQIKKSTLEMLAKVFGENTKMTPENQDKMALYLILEVRKGREFLEGRISQKEFMKNLAMEWASLPLESGKSYYAGDKAGNHSRVDYNDFRKIVMKLKESKENLKNT